MIALVTRKRSRCTGVPSKYVKASWEPTIPPPLPASTIWRASMKVRASIPRPSLCTGVPSKYVKASWEPTIPTRQPASTISLFSIRTSTNTPRLSLCSSVPSTSVNDCWVLTIPPPPPASTILPSSIRPRASFPKPSPCMSKHSPFLSRSWEHSTLIHKLSEEITLCSSESWGEMKKQTHLKPLPLHHCDIFIDVAHVNSPI